MFTRIVFRENLHRVILHTLNCWSTLGGKWWDRESWRRRGWNEEGSNSQQGTSCHKTWVEWESRRWDLSLSQQKTGTLCGKTISYCGILVWSFPHPLGRFYSTNSWQNQFVILSRSEEREEAAACLSEGWEMSEKKVKSSAKRERVFSSESVRSLMKIRKNMESRTLPWYSSLDSEKRWKDSIESNWEVVWDSIEKLSTSVEEVSNPRVELALDY